MATPGAAAAAAAQNFLAGHDNSLAALLQELGYGATVDEQIFKAILRHLPEPPTEQAVADVLLLMARTHTGLKEPLPSALWLALGLGQPPADAASLTSWNWPLVVDCLKAAAQGQSGRLSWAKVAECMDSERALLPDAAAFTVLASAFRRGAGEQLPVAALTGRMWKNPACQLALLKLAASAPPEVFTFESSKRLVTPLEGMNIAGMSPNRAWASVDLLQALCMLMEGAALVGPARDVLQYPAAACPELLLITISETRTTWNLLQRDVFAALLPQHINNAAQVATGPTPPAGKARSRELLTRVWSAAPPEVLLDLLIELYMQDPANATPRIARVCMELGVLPQVLGSLPLAISLEVAAYAGGTGMLNLEAWLGDYCNRDIMTAMSGMMRLVLDKTTEPPPQPPGPDGQPGAPPPRGPPLAAEAARAILKVLQASAQAGLPVDMVHEMKGVQNAIAKQFPSLASQITALNDTFASDVEEEANSYFQAIYNEQRPIDEIIARMQAYKSSSNPREQEVFACMIHNLFDEYRFFARYPDRELHITAALFGSLIKHGLVSSITLGMALRYVLDALRKPPGNKMFIFGLEALRQFAHMIAPWPQFCAALITNPQLREADPELFARVEASQHAAGGNAAVLPPPTPTVSAGPPGGPPSGPPSQQSGPQGQQLDSGAGVAPDSNSQGSSRFLNLQPADTQGPAASGNGADVEVPPPNAAGGRGGKDVGPSGRDAQSMAPGGKIGGRDAGALGGPVASGPATASSATGAAAAAGGAQPSNTSLSMGDGDAVGINLAMQVAAASLAPTMGPSLAALVNTESLESAAEKYRDFKEPPEAVADKIHFIMNNITKDNMEPRSGEIRDRVLPDYLPWFANYMVVKRAAQEANFHTLYMSLLDQLGDRELYRLMVKTTMYYVKVLLYSERILKESNDRALLKNLGTWLGLLTYARNKPVLSRDLELKQVICEAYQRGRLIAVLPFVQKLLEGCRHSRVFKPSNPMVAGILSLLAELHAMKGLKMNNAFSIELIFKAFGLSPHDVKPSDSLKTLPRERITNPDWQLESIQNEFQGGPPLPDGPGAKPGGVPSSPPPPSSQAGGQPPASPGQLSGQGMRPPGVPLVPPGAPGSMDTTPKAMVGAGGPGGPGAGPEGMGGYGGMPGGPGSMGVGPGGVGPNAASAAGRGAPGMGGAGGAGGVPGAPGLLPDGGLFANLHQHVIINPSLGDIPDRLMLKRHVPAAVDRAIGEIITPVVERSVTIACYTTYELVLKDFAGDPDESRLRKAAHLMVSSLAGSLSLVTAKDPLRISLTNQLRQMLQPQVSDAAMLDNIVSVLVNDNLDLGCTLIERAATDKAVRDIDKSLQAAYDERIKARQAGKPWVDPAAYHGAGSRFPGSLPEGLRPRPGGIQAHHLRVYEDFTRIPRTAPAVPPPGAPGSVPGAPGMPPGAPGTGVPPGGAPPPPPGVAPRPPGYPGAPGSFQGIDALVAAAAAGGAGPDGAAKPLDGVRPDGAAAAAALLDRYLLWQQAVDAAISAKEANPGAGSDQSDLQALLAELSEALASGAAPPEDAAAFFARRILKHLYDSAAAGGGSAAGGAGGSKLSLSFHAACLELLNSAAPGGRVVSEVTLGYLAAEDERKFAPALVEMLLRLRLLSLPDLDAYMNKLLQTPALRTQGVSDMVLLLLRFMALRDGAVSAPDLPLTMDFLGRMALTNPPLAAMVEAARKAVVAPAMARPPGEIPPAVRDKAADPPGLRDQTLKLFEEWVHLLNMHAEDKALLGFLSNQVRSAGVLKMDDTTDRFLRTLTELAVAHCLASAEAAAAAAAAGAGGAGAPPRPGEAAGSGPLSYIATDALVALVAALVVQLGGGEALLGRYLGLLVGVIKRDADEATVKFNARPYLRIWVGLLSELGVMPGSHAAAAAAAAAAEGAPPPPAGSPPPAADHAAQLRYLRACGMALYALQPLSVPGFAFAWLELVSHRAFMPRVLTAPLASGWPLFASLLIALLRFLEPYLRAADLSESVKQLYKGCLRLLLVLLHDFPEFLCEHHFSLCEAIPPPAVQMRNLVLSAFPRNMRLPDPFTPNLKVDLLPEIQQLPRIVPDPETLLPEALRQQVDAFLRTRNPASLPLDLAKRCMTPAPDKAGAAAGDKAAAAASWGAGGPGNSAAGYNVPLINALVLYIGSQAKTVSSPLHPGAQEMYVRMAGELDAEGRYLLLNAMANQLRYPNAHTYYFSCTLLTLFLESKSEGLKEQITRTLLERLIVNRPHPWGLLITFIELIKNRRYNFWAHSFTKCAQEIENLFTSVSRSCLGTNREQEEAAAAAAAQQQQLKDGAGGVAVRA
ncbi:hypothetical protein HXX76_009742 [Chlamydomonas incerta]|uniref:CCR4-NOT transcription complex subunit 1 n=1 Tax=Chlamydomonas incerta TaxID=51695 RepID=A0A835SQ97_CHLIN|nr:hypothetical protein HXX76_009742 [Chlamydomonas incerta]|eukprot:KAG2431214.1 hypothetical protein HXX76_009742 [Chlamydomonas incerta]